MSFGTLGWGWQVVPRCGGCWIRSSYALLYCKHLHAMVRTEAKYLQVGNLLRYNFAMCTACTNQMRQLWIGN
eukprot:3288512-Amphidinium_carterae.1